MRIILILASLIAVSLAGCADGGDGTGPDPNTRNQGDLAAGTGAIAGLLVDDRFRPIELTDDAQSEFQTGGFVLLQETGEQVQSNENGEFTFLDLEPGEYTLRVTADGHEATPQRVRVTAGEFNEISVVARRLVSSDSLIITQEKALFTPCAYELIVIAGAWAPCTLDLSLDDARTDIQADYSEFAGIATAMVSEARFNQEGDFDLAVRVLDPETGGIGATYYSECPARGTDYLKITMFIGEIDDCGDRNVEFSLEQEIQTIMFAWSATHTLFEDTLGTNGLGVVLGVRAQLLDSIFLGEPAVDIESYCILCD